MTPSMKERRDRLQDERPVSAKDLAEMGYCEKRVLLAHLHGQRLTLGQRRSVELGRRAHERYYREGLAATSSTGADRRCFVATSLYGDAAWQTEALRRYRDGVLLRRRLGRWLVRVHYAIAPGACWLLTRMPWLRPPARAVVGMLLRAARIPTGGPAT